MNFEFSLDTFPLPTTPQGQWMWVAGAFLAPLSVNNPATGQGACRLDDRLSTIHVWWDNGPKFYIATYTHSISSTGAQTPQLVINLEWKNRGGGIEKSESISEAVNCSDSKRKNTWTFTIEPDLVEIIKQFSAQPLENVEWTPCR